MYDNDIINAHETERMTACTIWAEQRKDRKENKKAKKMGKDMLNYMPSPEEILIEKEKKQEISDLMHEVQNKLGSIRYDMLYEYFVLHKTQEDMQEKYEISQQAISKKIKKARKIAKQVVQEYLKHHEIEDCYTYELPQPMFCSPSLPFEKEAQMVGETYKYSNKIHYHTNCRLPEYFKICFADSSTKCSLCFGDFGENHCKNKKFN